MLLFPFYENIEDRRFLIVGGGRIAKQKLSVLMRFTDRITLVAEDFAPEVESLRGPEESCGPGRGNGEALREKDRAGRGSGGGERGPCLDDRAV